MSVALRTPRAEPTDGAREFAFDMSDFRQIATQLYDASGICLSEQKSTLVYARLVKRLRALGIQSFKDYCRLIASDQGGEERHQMVAALTTNVTAFFRERHHFDHLKATELPDLLRRAREGGRVRIWSAGCSKGHEPYSLAMTIVALMPEAERYDVKILATDIDPFVIAEGRQATYDAEDLAEFPQAERDRFFDAAGARFQVTDRVRNLVSFRQLNLIGPWPMKGRFDVVFCRNVTIYFDAQTQATLWSRFAGATAAGGLLCIGHSERLSGDAQTRFVPTGTTMYRRNEVRSA